TCGYSWFRRQPRCRPDPLGLQVASPDQRGVVEERRPTYVPRMSELEIGDERAAPGPLPLNLAIGPAIILEFSRFIGDKFVEPLLFGPALPHVQEDEPVRGVRLVRDFVGENPLLVDQLAG